MVEDGIQNVIFIPFIEDLFTLSSTDFIISSNSTFGAMASYLGNIPAIPFSRDNIKWNKYLNKQGYFDNKEFIVHLLTKNNL